MVEYVLFVQQQKTTLSLRKHRVTHMKKLGYRDDSRRRKPFALRVAISWHRTIISLLVARLDQVGYGRIGNWRN